MRRAGPQNQQTLNRRRRESGDPGKRNVDRRRGGRTRSAAFEVLFADLRSGGAPGVGEPRQGGGERPLSLLSGEGCYRSPRKFAEQLVLRGGARSPRKSAEGPMRLLHEDHLLSDPPRPPEHPGPQIPPPELPVPLQHQTSSSPPRLPGRRRARTGPTKQRTPRTTSGGNSAPEKDVLSSKTA